MSFHATGFDELEDKLDNLARSFERAAERRRAPGQTYRNPKTGRFISVKQAIEHGFSAALNDIVEDAQNSAKTYGLRNTDAETIGHRSRGWKGDNYDHSIYGNHMVAYHEFGTGLEGPHKSKYKIEPKSEPVLSFHWDKIGQDVAFEYVWHPGVKAKHFIEHAINRNGDAIREETADRLDDVEYSDL